MKNQKSLRPNRHEFNKHIKEPSRLKFLAYALILLVVITSVCLIVKRDNDIEERRAESKADIERYAKLLEPLPPTPTPTPTPLPKPIEIRRLAPAPSTPTYTSPNWSTPLPTPDYSSSSDSYSDYSSGGGTVSVRGYYRRNGTYVSPYTRRSPRR